MFSLLFVCTCVWVQDNLESFFTHIWDIFSKLTEQLDCELCCPLGKPMESKLWTPILPILTLILFDVKQPDLAVNWAGRREGFQWVVCHVSPTKGLWLLWQVPFWQQHSRFVALDPAQPRWASTGNVHDSHHLLPPH